MAASQTFSNYPNGFAGTLLLRGVPLVQTHPGKVYWVSNNTTNLENGLLAGSNGNTGGYRDPFSTIAYALTIVKAGRGDIILVKPGHAETISAAAGLILSVAGVAIIGLGNGSNRPTITLGTANTASITVTANDVVISNFLFKANFLNIATVFNIANAQVATDFTIDSCEFRDDAAGILNFVSVLTIGTTANISDGLVFTNNKIYGAAATPAAATTAITLGGTAARWFINGNFCSHQVLLAATAVLIAAGANNIQNSIISQNRVVRPNTDASNPLMISNSGTSWLGTMIADNYAGQLSGATGLLMNVSSKASFMNNFAMVTGAADKSALINPVAV